MSIDFDIKLLTLAVVLALIAVESICHALDLDYVIFSSPDSGEAGDEIAG